MDYIKGYVDPDMVVENMARYRPLVYMNVNHSLHGKRGMYIISRGNLIIIIYNLNREFNYIYFIGRVLTECYGVLKVWIMEHYLRVIYIYSPKCIIGIYMYYMYHVSICQYRIIYNNSIRCMGLVDYNKYITRILISK